MPTPVQLTTEQDHQRMMDLLGIASLRPGANGWDTGAPNPPNYDESKANPYPNLPNPLTFNDGSAVKTADDWWEKRRPEIVELFDREIYGRVPKHTPQVDWAITATKIDSDSTVPSVTKDLIGHVDNSACPEIEVNIDMIVTTPRDADCPVPILLQLGFPHGRSFAQNQTPFPPQDISWREQLLAKGWGYAIIAPYSVQADNGAGLTSGIIGFCNHGQPRGLDDWGALRAWAWGASPALDYFEADPNVDEKQVGVEGLSRFGKASLIAMAYDARFAVAFVCSSGEAGAKLFRRNWGEKIGNIAGSGEYHWMAGNFIKYAADLTENDLPTDAHELIALCAPRPVFIGTGANETDGWADAKGMFMAAAASGPVYKLLGKRDLGTTEYPPIETSLLDGEIAFRQHSEGHTEGPNWSYFFQFASRYSRH